MDSRTELIIRALLGEQVSLPSPLSRIETLLLRLGASYEERYGDISDIVDAINGEVVGGSGE